MENKSIQDILDVDVGAIVKQGKATQKKRKRIAVTMFILVLLAAGGVGSVRFYRTYKHRLEIQKLNEQEIHEVEAAIENIGPVNAESEQAILYAWQLYDDLDNDLKAYVKNYSLLKDAREKYTIECEIPELLEKTLSERERCMTLGDYTAVKSIVEDADSIIQEPLVKMMFKTLVEEIISKGCTYEDVCEQYIRINSALKVSLLFVQESDSYYEVVEFFRMLQDFANGEVNQQKVLDKKESVERLLLINS